MEMYNDSSTCKIDSVRALQTMENMFQLKWSKQQRTIAKAVFQPLEDAIKQDGDVSMATHG